MPGPVDKPVVTVTPSVSPESDPPKDALAAPATVTAEIPPPIPTSEGTEISQVASGSVAMPPVAYELPPVQGQKVTDRGDDAEFVVLHTRFGRFVQGSRIALKDICEGSDIPGLIAIGAIAELPKVKPEPEPEPEPPAKKAGK